MTPVANNIPSPLWGGLGWGFARQGVTMKRGKPATLQDNNKKSMVFSEEKNQKTSAFAGVQGYGTWPDRYGWPG